MTNTQLDSILREVRRRAIELCADGDVDAALDHLDKYKAGMLSHYTEYSMEARSEARKLIQSWRRGILLEATGLADDLREI